jgi:hypothetical protein
MFYNETLRDQWESADCPGGLRHGLDGGLDEFIHLERDIENDLLAIEVGYFDHAGYTHCNDGTGDGGTIILRLALDPKPENWEVGGLIWKVLEQMVEAVQVVRTVTDRRPKAKMENQP